MDQAMVMMGAISNLQLAMMDIAAKVYWLYNAVELIDRFEAKRLIEEFVETYDLGDITIVDQAEFDELTPDMFDDGGEAT